MTKRELPKGFADDLLEWMKEEDIRDTNWLDARHHRCTPKAVTNVVAYGSDYADGNTEDGYIGDTDVTISWTCEHGGSHATEIKPGDQMASLWDFMIKKWKGVTHDG